MNFKSKVLSLLFSCFCLASISSFAQSKEEMIPIAKQSKVDNSQEAIFTIVEEMPEFPGGQDSMMTYLSLNTNYPDEALENGIEGIVYITFVVQKDGKVTEVRVLRGIGGGCDEEAKRVIEEMPNWSPGTQKGKPVNVQYNIPIRFKYRGLKFLGKKKKKKK